MEKVDKSLTFYIKPFRIDKDILFEVCEIISECIDITLIKIGNLKFNCIEDLNNYKREVANEIIIVAEFFRTDEKEENDRVYIELNISKQKSFITISDEDNGELYLVASKIKNLLDKYYITPTGVKIFVTTFAILTFTFLYISSLFKVDDKILSLFIGASPLILMIIFLFLFASKINLASNQHEILFLETLRDRKFSLKDKKVFIYGFLSGVIASLIAAWIYNLLHINNVP
jgi:hypothetical protein